jgi:hypothetical protein
MARMKPSPRRRGGRSAGIPGGTRDHPGTAALSDRFRTRSDDGVTAAAVKVAPSGSPSARPDGPPLTAAPAPRFCSEVRHRLLRPTPVDVPDNRAHCTHQVQTSKNVQKRPGAARGLRRE